MGFKRLYYHTKEKISRVYMIYACFLSGIIGFGKSIKAQYKVWKSERDIFFGKKPDPEEV